MVYDIIIVGAGTAGLTSAIYARRAEKTVLVFEEATYGGQIIETTSIENYPAEPNITGFDFATKLYNQTKALGTEIKFERVTKIINNESLKEVWTNKDKYEAKTVILATGLVNRKLGLENENQFLGKGISYCATCDGSFYKKKDVAVFGGGNTALQETLYLADIANKVYIIHRRDEFRGDKTLVSKIKTKENIIPVYNSIVTELLGNDKLEAVEVTNTAGEKQNLSVSGLFVSIGKVPGNESFSDLIELDKLGYIVAGEDCHTNVDGIFVAGDIRTKTLRQLVTATSDGAVATIEAIKYIAKLK